MKKLNFLSIIIILIAGISFYACSNDKNEGDSTNNVSKVAQDLSIPKDMGGIKWGPLTLPKGTISEISQNGSRLDFKLPKNYIYAAKDDTGEVFFTDSGSYTCTSSCTGGCNVVLLGDDIGCSSCPEGSTESCTGKFGTMPNGKNIAHQIGGGNNGGLINLNKGISFVSIGDNKVTKRQSPNFDILMAYPKIETDFDAFWNKIWNGKNPNPENSKEVLATVYGTTISLLIPIEVYKNSKIQMVEGKSISCSCSSGQTGCTLKPIKKGFVTIGHQCTAGNCTSCTMNY